MDEEFFYGATLDKAGASITWSFEDNEEHPGYKLYIKQILLGHTAKEGEYNVVEVDTLALAEAVKIPLAVLKVGETRSVMTNLEFPDAPVTFKLIEGNGPVYIHGNQVPIYMESVDEMEGEADAVEEEKEEEKQPVSKKRKLPENGEKETNGTSNNHKNSKKSVK